MAIPGNWELNIEWGCAGGYSAAFVALNDDGTWWQEDEEFQKGAWFQVDDRLFLTANNAAPIETLLYVGTIINNLVIGRMVNTVGDSGCFYMGKRETLAARKPAPTFDLVRRPTAA